jgi:quercetin dioxygenase-like cupin family protein
VPDHDAGQVDTFLGEDFLLFQSAAGAGAGVGADRHAGAPVGLRDCPQDPFDAGDDTGFVGGTLENCGFNPGVGDAVFDVLDEHVDHWVTMVGVPAPLSRRGLVNSRKIIVAVAQLLGIVAVIVACGAHTPSASEPVSRTDLQRHDLSIPGRVVIQTRVDFQPGATAPRHEHPGEEIIYVLKGTLVYDIDGQGSKTVKAGDVLFVPAETVHSVRNIGGDQGSELATYIVDPNRPLVIPAP